MAWLRLDDGFTKHPKFAGWTVGEKWALLELMEYCARYRTSGKIPADLSILPRSTSPKLITKAVESGWIDVDEDGTKTLHDWHIYNPEQLDEDTIDERVAEVIHRFPEATANEVHRIVGGRKQAVLAAVKRFRTGSDHGSQGGSGNQSGTGLRAPARDTRAGTRARSRPVPSPEDQPSSSSRDVRAQLRQALDDDDLEKATTALGLSAAQHAIVTDTDPARLRAILQAALDPKVAKVAAYVVELAENGSWPETAQEPTDDLQAQADERDRRHRQALIEAGELAKTWRPTPELETFGEAIDHLAARHRVRFTQDENHRLYALWERSTADPEPVVDAA